MKKVVVTGMGIVSPVGNSVDSFWNSLCNGKSGIGPITNFDTITYIHISTLEHSLTLSNIHVHTEREREVVLHEIMLIL